MLSGLVVSSHVFMGVNPAALIVVIINLSCTVLHLFGNSLTHQAASLRCFKLNSKARSRSLKPN